MTLREFFVTVGGDYDEVLGRLGSEKLILKFVRRMPEEPTFQMLKDSMESGNIAEAFRAAHTIKGVCLNLGLDALGKSSGDLTEMLRPDKNPDGVNMDEVRTMYEKVSADYACMMDAVKEL